MLIVFDFFVSAECLQMFKTKGNRFRSSCGTERKFSIRHTVPRGSNFIVLYRRGIERSNPLEQNLFSSCDRLPVVRHVLIPDAFSVFRWTSNERKRFTVEDFERTVVEPGNAVSNACPTDS